MDAYLSAMQVHQRCVRDLVVAGCRVEVTSWGAPLTRSGTFALTCKVSEHIHRALSASPWPYFVDFACLESDRNWSAHLGQTRRL